MPSYVLNRGTIKGIEGVQSFSNGFLLGLTNYLGNYGKNDEQYEKMYYTSSIIYNAVTLISNSISNLPKKFMSFDNTSVSENVINSLGNSQYKLWSELVRDYYLYGRFFLEPVKTSVGLRFRRINPSTMEIITTNRGINKFTQRVNTTNVDWDASDLIYVHNYNPSNDLTGLSLVGQTLNEFGVDQSLLGFINDYFENGGTPLGILTTDQSIRPTDAQRYAQNWKESHSGTGKRNSVAVLGSNLSYQPITPSIKDISTNEIYLFIGRRISQLFGVPIDLLGVADYENRASSDNSSKNFYIHTIIPTFNIIASQISEQSSEHFEEEFSITADEYGIDVLQNDRQILTDRATELFIKGVSTLNESRKIAQLEPIKEGDLHFIGGRLLPQSELPNFNVQTNLLNDLQSREVVNPQNDKEAKRLLSVKSLDYIDLIIADLKKYKSKALKKQSNKFESNYIPKTINDFIRLDLRNKASNISTIFDRYIAYFRDTDFTDESKISELESFINYWNKTPYDIMRLSDTAYNIYFDGLVEELIEYFSNNESTDDIYDKVLLPRQIELIKYLRDNIGIYPITNTLAEVDKGLLEDIGSYIRKAKDSIVEMVSSLTKTTLNMIITSFENTKQSMSEFSNTLRENKLPEVTQVSRLDIGIENIISTLKTVGMLEQKRLFNKNLRFKTQLDELVCPICSPYHNAIVTNDLLTPPLHLRCRCYLEAYDGI